MPGLDDLISSIPVSDIARRLGVPEEQARAAVTKAVPGLVRGMESNAKDPSGAASLEKALHAHRDRPVERASADDIDEDEGERIVGKVFGDRRPRVAQALASEEPKADESLISRVLPLVAPLVLAWLAKQGGGAGGLGGLLGGVLGGGGGTGGGSGLDGLGGALGGLLGGRH